MECHPERDHVVVNIPNWFLSKQTVTVLIIIIF